MNTIERSCLDQKIPFFQAQYLTVGKVAFVAALILSGCSFGISPYFFNQLKSMPLFWGAVGFGGLNAAIALSLVVRSGCKRNEAILTTLHENDFQTTEVSIGEHKISMGEKECLIRFNEYCRAVKPTMMLQGLKKLRIVQDIVLFQGATSSTSHLDFFDGAEPLNIKPNVQGNVLLIFIPGDMKCQNNFFNAKFAGHEMERKQFLMQEGHKGYVMSAREGREFMNEGKLSAELIGLLTKNENPKDAILGEKNVFRKPLSLGDLL